MVSLFHFTGKMARVTGLEPATSGVTGQHSNRLSYTRANLPKQVTRLIRNQGAGVKQQKSVSSANAISFSNNHFLIKTSVFLACQPATQELDDAYRRSISV